MTQTLGERNNNPGNLVYERSNPWLGLAPSPSDGRFCVFNSPLYGIRALARTLIEYQSRDNCITLAQIVNRWAPPVENDTGSYLGDVCQRLGMLPSSVPTFIAGSLDLVDLVKAIITHENGRCIYDDTLIGQAVGLAQQ